ncbi:ATP-binding cassette domain-containing protein [Sphingomonas sp.]|uniref:ABC transporter ATP-binding protein n=1 Tax=Sphingomonas sp. TaxID=28214 RepID=UPI003B00C632
MREAAPILSIRGVAKRYKSGTEALKPVDLDIRRGEIFALLGPNGAGKTTLISMICGSVRMSAGTVIADGHDTVRDYRAARAKIGLVPQELSIDIFERVEDVVAFSRGLFGQPRDPARIEAVLRSLSLWDKRQAKLLELSGGMKRRVLIAKALAHDPTILFLDEPTAGVDVGLRRDMWALVRQLRDDGVTIILTTHYIEEAEEMADRIGVIDRGELKLVEDKDVLMRRLGKQTLTLELERPIERLPDGLEVDGLGLDDNGCRIRYVTGGGAEALSVPELIRRLDRAGVAIRTIDTRRSTLEDIFVELTGGRA